MNIYYADRENFEIKKRKIISNGKDTLQIISDFDKTLTKFQVEGGKLNTSFSQFREGGYISESYVEESNKLKGKYLKIELDPTKTIAEKTPFMEEWWQKHMQLLIEKGLKQEHIDDIVAKKSTLLRSKTHNCIQWSQEHKVPFLVFTAGVGNVVQQVLQSNNLFPENVHLIGNTFQFDENGKAISYDQDVIHVFNKNEKNIQKYPYAQEISGRKNVILIGDNEGDAAMADGIDHETVLKIGILNEGNDHDLTKYLRVFDVIIKDTDDLDFFEDLLREIA